MVDGREGNVVPEKTAHCVGGRQETSRDTTRYAQHAGHAQHHADNVRTRAAPCTERLCMQHVGGTLLQYRMVGSMWFCPRQERASMCARQHSGGGMGLGGAPSKIRDCDSWGDVQCRIKRIPPG